MRVLPCEQIASSKEFRHLSTLANIRIDLRYASANNFMGRDMYSPLDCAWLHVDAAKAIESAVAWLTTQRNDVTLCILDALRPHRVQIAMWDALDDNLRKYLAPPERGSIHSYGMAVDATLLDANGVELDMGTGFDEMSEASHPEHESSFIATGDLRADHLANRHLLRDAMRQAGFNGIATEWWHFDCGDRARVRSAYTRVI
ncbi:MAG: M15 family metallopeptidase [Casimicrobium sp.]